MMTLDQAFDAGLLIDESGRPIVSRKQLADAKWITVHPNGARDMLPKLNLFHTSELQRLKI